MAQIQRSVMIDAPAERVFALLCDTNRFSDWVAGFGGLITGPDTLTAESSFRWRLNVLRLTFRPRSTITTFSAPESYKEAITIPGVLRGTLVKTAITEKRRVRLTWVLEYRLTGGPLGVAADWALAQRLAERNMQQSLAQAKTLLEAEKRAGAARGSHRRQPGVR